MHATSAPQPFSKPVPAEPESRDVVLLARQPILDDEGQIFGSELLYRRPDGTGWPIEDEEKATAHVLVAAFADMNLGAVTSGARAWINVTRTFLLDTDVRILPPDRVVLELLERNEVDDLYLARVRELVATGYTVALDDFTWDDALVPVLELATYVKLDLRELGVDGVAQHVERLAPYDVCIVAEKVETAEERDACRELGITLFQGYFFEKPRLVRGRPTPHATLRRLRIATGLGPDAKFEDVERVVMLDPGLSLRLLRYINSAAVSLRSRVSSLRHALMLVGTNTVRQWILLVLLGDLGSAQPAVLSSGLVRARLCETLARNSGLRAADSAFVVGLLSVCDALLDTPIDEVMATLPLTEDVRTAIVSRQGRLGELLGQAIALQRGDAREIKPRDAEALAEAIRWADVQLDEFTAVQAGSASAAASR